MGHFSRNCKVKEKINNLEIDEFDLLKSIKNQLKILLLESDSKSEASQEFEDSVKLPQNLKTKKISM